MMKIARVIDRSGQTVNAALGKNNRLYHLTGDPLAGKVEISDETVTAESYLAPIEPRAIICVGLNYRQHAVETGKAIPSEPVLFMKNPAAAIGTGQAIVLPAVCGEEVDYECELAVVIGKTCKNAVKEKALQYVAGYTAANDISARLWQADRCGGQWIRGKSFDTFAPLGPYLVTPEEVPNPNTLTLRTLLNGTVMQDSTTADMIFDAASLIAFISQDTTLLPGTVILTGTPSGVGWARQPKCVLHKGDTVCVEVESLGRLENPVV